MKRPWTDEDIEEATRMVRGGASIQTVADVQRRSRGNVQAMIHAMLGDIRKRYIWVAYDGDEWIVAAMIAEDLAKALHAGGKTIYTREYRYRNGKMKRRVIEKFERESEEVKCFVRLGTD